MDSDRLSGYIQRYQRTVYRAAFSYVGSCADAEDIVQDTFVKLYTYNGRFESEEHVKAWLIRVAVNLSKNLLRSRRRRGASEVTDHGSCDRENELLAAVMELPPSYREVIYLYYYEGYSAKEIAAILRHPVSTVTTRLSRGRKLLKDMLLEG
ncbi:MAG: sigma-70 family RNA polymerase sigma factor [Oscillospiraceae bacterium]|nr:sigma-70 family RNA polymerase sigma factor [Oscillospiraceae bacterium]